MIEGEGRYIVDFDDIPAPRQKVPELSIEERAGNFKEVELGFAPEMAVSEAGRCLSCRKCLGCALCLAECTKKAIDFEQAGQDIELVADSIILAPGAERFSCSIDDKFGCGIYTNVITGLEFERILSDTGPYGGLVLRPYDGEIPKKIAFVQCADYHGEGCECAYRSLAYAVKEATLARSKVDALEVSVFFSGAGEHEEEFGRLHEQPSSFRVVKGEVLSVSEVEDSKNLVIKFVENDQPPQEEEFERVVLSTATRVASNIEEVTRKLGVQTGKRCYWEKEDTSLSETSRPGVFLAGYTF